jgi:hypothetical protein
MVGDGSVFTLSEHHACTNTRQGEMARAGGLVHGLKALSIDCGQVEALHARVLAAARRATARGRLGPRPGRGGAPRRGTGFGERGGGSTTNVVHRGGTEASVRRGNTRPTRGTRVPSSAAGERARRRRLAGPAQFHLPYFENA